MASLRMVPGDVVVPLDPHRPCTIGEGDAVVVIASHRRRWLLFDVSGAARVDARAVSGAARTLAEGALLSVGGRRLRLVSGGPAALVEARARTRCAYCRDDIELAQPCLECPRCRRLHHPDCARAGGRCGRCAEVIEA